jgi:hypothetical protein
MTTAETIAARANHYSTVAHDTWKLGALTASLFAEVTELCLAAVKDFRDYADETEATRLLDEAAALLDHVA